MSPLDIPDSLSETLFFSVIKPGTVLRFYDREANKEKRVIILGTDNDRILACYVRINSEINLNVFRTLEQRECQYAISASCNNFLDHDSFVDCTFLCECSIRDLVEYMKKRGNAILGNVQPNDLDSMTTLVVQSETSIPNQLRRFGLLPPKNY